MLRRLFLLLVAAVSCALASAAPVGAASTTIAEAVPGVYDAPVTTRGAIQGLGDLTNASSQPAGSQERSAARSVTTQGQSTTPHSRSVATEAAGGVADDALAYATRAEKLDHIFVPKHNLDPLVQQLGSREAVVEQMLGGVKGLTPTSGTFEIPVTIGGQTVVVRGAVVDGIVKLGTAFTP